MPEPADATLEARISRALDARTPALEQLVAAAVDARLVTLVDLELDRALQRLAATSTNGATPAPSSTPPATSTSSLCSRCGERPRLPGRTLCRDCRRERERELARARPREHRETTTVGAQDDTSDEPGRPADPEAAPPADEHTTPHSAPAGTGGTVTAEQLLAQATSPARLTADQLEHWLLEQGLAEPNGAPHALVPTARAYELAGALA